MFPTSGLQCGCIRLGNMDRFGLLSYFSLLIVHVYFLFICFTLIGWKYVYYTVVYDYLLLLRTSLGLFYREMCIRNYLKKQVINHRSLRLFQKLCDYHVDLLS